jgi:hypothetical protein
LVLSFFVGGTQSILPAHFRLGLNVTNIGQFLCDFHDQQSSCRLGIFGQIYHQDPLSVGVVSPMSRQTEHKNRATVAWIKNVG